MPAIRTTHNERESPILTPINEAMNVPLAQHPSSQLTSMNGFAGSVVHYSHPIEMEGTMAATDEQNDEAMSFLLQDMMRQSSSPSMAPHVVQSQVEFDLPSLKGYGYVPPDTQVWTTGPGLADSTMTTSVNLGFDERVRGTHFDQGQVDLIMTPHCGLSIQGLEFHQYQHRPLQDYHSLVEGAHYQAHDMNTNNFGQGLSGLQFEQCAPGEVAIGMATHPILSNNTCVSSTPLAPVFPSQILSSSHGSSVFPSEQVIVDTTMSQATFEYEQMLTNTIKNCDQFNHLAPAPTYAKHEPAFNGEFASNPLAQFGHANLLDVLTPDLHHSHYSHFPMVKAHTPIETPAPLTPCNGAPAYLHHSDTAPSYFPPMSSNESLVTPPHNSGMVMVPTQQMVPSNLMTFGSIEVPAHFQSVPVDPSVMTMVPTHLASWPNMSHPQVSPHAFQQSLELVHRLQIIHQLQLQQQDHSASQSALYHRYQTVDHVSGESGPSTPQSITTPLPLPDTPSTAPYATPQQFQYFPEGTVNMSAIHPSTSDFVDKSSLSCEKTQALVDHAHSENYDVEPEDDDEEEPVPESDNDSSYHDDGNNISSSSYHDHEDDIDSDDESLLQEKRTPSPPSPVDDDYSEKVPTTRRKPTRARRARATFTPTETAQEEETAELISSTEAKPSRRRKPATSRRVRANYTSETVEEEVSEQSPPTETPPSRHRKPTASRRSRTPHVPTVPMEEAAESAGPAPVKRRKPRARRATATAPTYTEARKEADADDGTTSDELPLPMVLEDGTIKCAFLGCPRTFTTMGLLRSHLVVHVEGKPYVCEMCHGDKRYKRNHDLLRHQREIHVEAEEEDDEPEDKELDEEAEVEGGEDMSSSSSVRRRGKREEAPPSTFSGRRHRKHRRTRVEHRTIWNGSEMEEIEVEMVRPRGRPRVRPLKNTPAADAFALISSSVSSSSLAVVARSSQTAPSTQNADTAKRLHEWLRIEAQATVAWSVQQTCPSTGEHHTGPRPPVFASIDEHEPTNQLIKRDEDDDELVRTGQWRALNERADAQNEATDYALHSLKEWLLAPESAASPRSPGYVVQSMLNAFEAPAPPTCHVATNIVAAATEQGTI
ncbi:MAG: hypothetical protein BYD32DRAFT_441225 [Podila humilis]|nr:MAG: hypothetical protein BYD32DRAFT_441225 [Podila humilis]